MKDMDRREREALDRWLTDDPKDRTTETEETESLPVCHDCTGNADQIVAARSMHTEWWQWGMPPIQEFRCRTCKRSRPWFWFARNPVRWTI